MLRIAKYCYKPDLDWFDSMTVLSWNASLKNASVGILHRIVHLANKTIQYVFM